jgi:hypothetical protein
MSALTDYEDGRADGKRVRLIEAVAPIEVLLTVPRLPSSYGAGFIAGYSLADNDLAAGYSGDENDGEPDTTTR